MSAVSEALTLAVQHHQAGRLRAAEQIYRQILADEPDHADACHLLGLVAFQLGDSEAAIEHIGRALRLQGTNAAYHNSLGAARRAQGRLKDAVASYRRAVELRPDYFDAHNNLGNALKALGRLQDAAASYRRALALKPDSLDVHNKLGNTLQALGELDEALASYRRALELKPDGAAAHNNLGNALQAAGKSDEALASYRRALELKPDYASAYNNLGNALQARGRITEALASYRRALELGPDSYDAHNNLGVALKALGKLADAEASYRRALELKPDYAETHNNLGNALQAQGKLDEALASYRRALELKPDYAEAYNNLGNTLQALGELDEALASYRRALELKPDYADAHNNLGHALKDQGRITEALASHRRALELGPNSYDTHNHLGVALTDLGKLDDAEASYRRALELKPDHAETHNNLGNALQAQGKLDEALASYRRSLELKPDYAEAYNNLGNALKDHGRVDDATACYHQALELKPDLVAAHSNLLMAIQYRVGATLADLAAAHAQYQSRFGEPPPAVHRQFGNVPDPNRKLRVGFVSSDLGRHPVGYFLIGALEHAAQGEWETVCYSDRTRQDDLTARFRTLAQVWRDVAGWGVSRLAEQILEDRIDILFDLAGHTAKNRLPVFARKPAPIQVTWAGYVGTTGLKAIDYILADRYEIPVGAEFHYCERVLRMPDGYVCYDPPSYAAPVSPLPALRHGYVTFGSFNNSAKINRSVIERWAQILHRVPQSRLVLKYRGMTDRSIGAAVEERFAGLGIALQRLEFRDFSPHADSLAEYNRIDIALDPFPYSGGLTTCEALWMGVPVVTCPGETFASRHSLSHLSNVGLTETIAGTLDEYVEIAVALSNDLPRLAGLRARLRDQMARSPLCDGKRFAANLQAVVRGIWQAWCESCVV